MNLKSIFAHATVLVLLPLSLLSACGGGGGSSGGSGTTVLSGAVIDGYIQGATVCLDMDNNGTCNAGDYMATASTTTSGVYTILNVPSTAVSGHNVIAVIPASAVDSDTGSQVGTGYTMAAPAAEASVVTPFTTLVAQYMSGVPALSAQNAATQVVSNLGLPAGTNLFQDYIAASGVAGDLHGVAQLVVSVALQNPGQPASAVIDSSVIPVYAQLNTLRQYAGAGMLSNNSALNAAAASHSSYLVNNNLVNNAAYLSQPVSGVTPAILGGHYENSNNAGYTGTRPSDRAASAGYSGGSVSELLSFGVSGAASCAASIEDSVYHLIEVLSPFNDVGLAYNPGSNSSGAFCAIELGATAAQYPAAGSYVYYPGNGQTGVVRSFVPQSESPAPPASNMASAGHPVVFSLYNQANTSIVASNVVVTGFTLTDPNSNAVPATVLVSSGVSGGTVDANLTALNAPGMLVLLPASPLASNTTYTATLSATVNGSPVSQTWSFTTGN